MSRIIGRVENPTLLGTPRYFVHDSTSGYSSPVLFASSDEAWDAYGDDEDFRGLEKAVPAVSKEVMVVEVTFAFGKSFSPDGEIFAGPTFGVGHG